jgi:hypothetical protein
MLISDANSGLLQCPPHTSSAGLPRNGAMKRFKELGVGYVERGCNRRVLEVAAC